MRYVSDVEEGSVLERETEREKSERGLVFSLLGPMPRGENANTVGAEYSVEHTCSFPTPHVSLHHTQDSRRQHGTQ